MKRQYLEIITSAFNEEDCVEELYSRIRRVMDSHPNYDWRIIFCDNNSTDRTWELIQGLSASTGKILGVRLSRTFSLDSAFTMGIDIATADAIVIMASDLQDPPEVIHEFIEKYEEGFEQVVAKIVRREHVPLVRRILSKWFYVLANKATGNVIPRGVSDFRLMNRPAYLAARKMQEKNRFLRGLIAWTGFKTAVIEIERPARFAGESKFVNIPIRKIVRWALSAILAHTTAPLTWLSIFGFTSSFISLISTSVFSVLWIVSGVPFAGFGTIVGLVTLGFSLTMLSIGILAHYLALIYDEVKARPIYLVAERTDGEL
ncbi:WcaA Glycosyltransferases involved in cell wall biogenesis [Candidatus Nanopelagicaceae bacterium]